MLLKRYNKIWWLVGLSLLLLLTSCQTTAAAYEYKGAVMEPPMAIPDFALQDTAGDTFHLSDIQDNIVLIYFGYTFCPDVCPMTLWDVREALADLEGRENIKVLFISVDPERDTPEVLARYTNAFDPTFIGLTDEFTALQQVMKPFGAFAEKEEVSNSAANYLVNHTARVYLLTPNRELLLTYPFGFEPDDLRADLTYLIQQYNEGDSTR